MEKKLPTTQQLRECFDEHITHPFGKTRSLSFVSETENEKLSMKPSSPHNTPYTSIKYKSNSVTLPQHKSRSLNETFYCKNVSNNLTNIITDVSNHAVELPDVSMFDHDKFEVDERIIPAYYINENGIKEGTFEFNFYNSIIDSIRNLRELTKHQTAFLEKCSQEEYMEIIMEYNNVIQSFVKNSLL